MVWESYEYNVDVPGVQEKIEDLWCGTVTGEALMCRDCGCGQF